MFGYVKPNEAELLVKEQELYRAVYCGLCQTMRRRVSFFASFSLNYDLVFLALLRAELTGEIFHFCQKRCPVHPLKKRNCATHDSPTLEHTALVHLALTFEKLKDDLRDADASWMRRVLIFLYYPTILLAVHKMKRKSPVFSQILSEVSGACNKLAELEKANTTDIDALAHTCAEGIARGCATALNGNQERLMYTAAAVCGQLVYLLDAADDLEKDAKRASFNPYLSAYKTSESVKEHLSDIDVTLALYARELDRTVDLIVDPRRYAPICKNVTQKGIPGAIHRVISKYEQNHSERIEK